MRPESTSQTSVRGHLVFLFAFAAACLLVLAVAGGASGQPGEGAVDEDPGGIPYAAGELIVAYEESIEEAPVRSLAAEVEAEIEDSLPSVDAQLLDFPEIKQEDSGEERERLLEEKKRELEGAPAVAEVSYNYERPPHAVPNDRLFDRQWNLSRVSAPVAWNRENGDGQTKIAIIDSGADLDHPDLRAKVSASINVANPAASANDTSGHGTHVTGIAAASTNNRIGVAGSCPECGLLIARVTRADGGIFVSDVIAGIEWAIANGADVMNFSLGGPGAVAAEELAINNAWNAGIVMAGSAGNDDSNTRTYPAAYANVIAVSATTRQDARARYSNYGGWIDVAAPGGERTGSGIVSTLPGGRYGVKSGTSMASPVVAGIAGLLASQGLGNVEIRRRIESTPVDLGKRGKDAIFGHGRVDAAAAVGARARNTHPTITGFRPAPGARLRTNRVRISAVVRDRETDLRKRNITLIIDGKRTSFGYNASNDRLTKVARLSPGRHNVRIVVRDGWGLSSAQTRRFSVAGRSPGTATQS